MSIKIGEKKILRSPLEPKDRNWLWLKTVAGFPVLHEYLSGKWVPFSDATAEYMETHILSRVFGSTRYDKDNHCIEFYAADGSEAPIGVIDTSEFEVSIDTNNYYTKAEVEEYVSEYVSEHGGDSVDLSNYYTKPEVDVLVGGSHSYIAKFTMTVGVGTVNYSCNRTISNLNTAKDSGKVIIGTLGHSVGVLLYCDQQYAVFLFSDTYGELFQMCYNGSWYKQVVETGGSGDIEIDADPTEDSGNAVSSGGVFLALDNKVDKVSGKGLSTNDYTTAEKTKLAGLENYDDSTLQTAIDGKVDKESGKSLMSDAEHTKLAGIAAGAEVNVQSDWNQTTTTADDYIKNKPTLATVATSGSYNDLQDKPTIPAAYDDTTLSGRVSALENAGFITTETDPNVPSWAKADTKPTYTAQEVGALPASTTIPTKVSDLTNDSGFTSNAGTITGITMNNVSKGTSGVVDLGTVITAHQDISGKANTSDLADVATSGDYDDLTNKPTIPDVSGFATTTAMNTALAGKQDTLTFDTTPTANSTKPVTSGGIKTYVDGKATITGITTNQDGTFTIALSDGNSYTVNLNHVHPQYLKYELLADEAAYTALATKDSSTLYLIPEA